MWATDRVRVCVREHCRFHKIAYTSMTREEGLELLATAAGMSVTDVEQMNPILYVRRYLNEFPDDAVELLIKLCQLFGPYSYKLMAAQLAGDHLEQILEVSEPPSPEKTEPPSLEKTEPIPSEEVIMVTDALELTVADEPIPEPKPEPEPVPEPEPENPEPEPVPKPEPESVKPTLQPLVRCGCWGW